MKELNSLVARWHMRALRALLLAPALLLANPAHAPAHLFAQDADALPMWEVRGGDQPVFLLGSIHLMRPEIYPLATALYDAFDASAVAVFELDLAEMVEQAPLMMQRGMLPAGRTLRDELPADVFAEFKRHATSLAAPTEMFEGMKPWMAALSLSSLVLHQAGFQAETGLDMHFHRRAQEADMRIIGLETMEDQINVFDELDRDAQAAFVRQTLADLENSAAQLDEATALWQRGDAQGLADMFLDAMRDQPVLMERLVYQRNRHWIPGIEALLQGDEPAIVIVGMGHLVGDGSVVQLLRERGYEVTRVMCGEEAVACGR